MKSWGWSLWDGISVFVKREEARRRGLSANQEGGSVPALPAGVLIFQLLSLQNGEKEITVRCLNHLVYDMLVRAAWTKILLRFVLCLCTSLGPWYIGFLYLKKKKHFSFLLQPFPQLLHPYLKPSWTPASLQPVLLFSFIKELLSFL